MAAMKDFLKLIFFGIVKTPKLEMFRPDTGEKKQMAFGFNLQILLIGGFFGLPVFFKRLWGWAWLMFCLSTAQFVSFYLRVKQLLSATTPEEYYAFQESDPIDSAAGVLLLVCAVLLAFKGNEWAVKRLVKKGWRFTDVSDPAVRAAAKKWKISKHYLKPVREEEKL